ncbi:serine/threonine-protein kinase [Marivirga sp.]|uniref:serine/threonine-protein kinase n=1 Tax=Marivirga sp. TaxID=2018662 RepID=UPI002D811483|nr:serine/threonine-protein kinase [Marivirga sp.]HET8859819.1 serine/threonine-protein kinase [Marivirga sp.]
MDYSWNKLEEIFQNALKLPAIEREYYVALQAKNDDRLRDTILTMLKDEKNADQYFDNLQAGIATGFEEKKEDIFKPGDIIDKYKIVKSLGRGGMGQVYLAERNDQQFEQKVAIKCFSAEEVKDNFLLNFRNEQQFLANLNHAAIAHILDGGITDSGIHYIIMEYVDGLPIDQFLRTNTLTTQEKIQLFLKICDAINYAHNRLILHLDIKPSNILVNADRQVKLLDFGIAQKIGTKLQHKNQKATPYFAAPEQINLGSITTATDIFQLGILFHIILTSKNPLNPKENNPFDRNLIISESLSLEIRSILEKCLNEQSDNRYTSVNELNSDLERYLQNRPISTLKHNNSYIFSKYIRRNKITIMLVGLAIVSLTSGIIFSSYQANKAQKSEQLALKQKERAEYISSFLIGFFESPNPRDNSKLGADFTVDEFLDLARDKVDNELSERPKMKYELLAVITNMYNNLGRQEKTAEIDKELISKYQKFLGDSSTQFLDAQIRLARFYSERGELAKADSMFNKIESNTDMPYFARGNALTEHALYYQNIKGDFKTADSLVQLSLNLFIENRDTLRKEFADALSIAGTIKNRFSNFKEAGEYYERELTIKNEISTNDPVDIALTKSNLATIYLQTGKAKKALKIQLEALKVLEENLGESHIHTMHAYNNLTHIYLDNYKFDSANYFSQKALKLYNSTVGDKSYETAYVSLNSIIFDIKKGNYEEAQNKIDNARASFERTLPPNHYLNSLLGIYQSSLAIAETNPQNALKAVQESKNYIKGVLPETHFFYAYIIINEARAQLLLNEKEQALKLLEQSFEILKESKGMLNYRTQQTVAELAKIYIEKGEMGKANIYQAYITPEFKSSKLSD